MNASPDAPTFNLKAVVQETGLKPDTLRAWERRYGLPIPQRTESGHRLYSQNDILLLKWLIARQEEGMSISRAIELWRRLEEEQHDPLQTLPLQSYPSQNTNSSIALIAPPTTAQPLASGTMDTLLEIREAWVAACMNFDEQQAEYILAQAFGLFSVERVCLDLLQKGLARIGDGWYAGKVTVQQEHFASALAMRRLEALMITTPSPTRPGRILVGCPPEEEHLFAPLLLSLLLRRRGWDVLFLGADIPSQDFVLTTQTTRPNLIILTAQQLYTAATLREIGDLIYQVRTPMAFGGLIFTQIPALPTRITGHYLGATLEGAIQRVEELLSPVRLPQAVPPLSLPYEIALEEFRLNRAHIEAELWRTLGNSAIPHPLLRKANFNFGRDIMAALMLGDIHYLGVDLAWVKGLLAHHYQMPTGMVTHYLTAYLAAAETHLRERGTVLSQWLKHILAEEDQNLVIGR